MKYLLSTLMTMICLYSFTGCTDDIISGNGGSSDEPLEVNEWIYETMEKYYLWNDELPSSDKVNFSAEPTTFYTSLLSDKDGKSSYYYSGIEERATKTRAYMGDDLSCGFEYQIYYDEKVTPIEYFLRVLYVLPNSPASEADLKRGDYIVSINGKSITDKNTLSLFTSSSNFTVEKTDFPGNTTTKVSLTPRTVEDNPVYLAKVLSNNIGYLVYNHFTTGPGSHTNKEYDNALRQVFKEEFNSNIENFILDLRYNNGGYLSCAQLLASLLAPAEALGKTFCITTSNGSITDTDYKLLSSEADKNLNLKKLYVITSSRTASASEAVINGLLPYMGKEVNVDIILIGEQTEGKNVGSTEFEHEYSDWVISPIVCYVQNADKKGNYSEGFSPKVELSKEEKRKEQAARGMKELGDINEILLQKALEQINGTRSAQQETIQTLTTDSNLILTGTSLDRKNTNSIRISNIVLE